MAQLLASRRYAQFRVRCNPLGTWVLAGFRPWYFGAYKWEFITAGSAGHVLDFLMR
jgi:hypothetical protein